MTVEEREGQYVPPSNEVVEYLERNEEFQTTDLRMYLNSEGKRSPTHGLRRVMYDLWEDDIVEILEADRGNESWEVDSNVTSEDIYDALDSSYTNAEISNRMRHDLQKAVIE